MFHCTLIIHCISFIDRRTCSNVGHMWWKKEEISFKKYPIINIQWRRILPFGADGSISVSLISIWVLEWVSSTGTALSVNRWYWIFSLWAIRLTNIFVWKNIRWAFPEWIVRFVLLRFWWDINQRREEFLPDLFPVDNHNDFDRRMWMQVIILDELFVDEFEQPLLKMISVHPFLPEWISFVEKLHPPTQSSHRNYILTCWNIFLLDWLFVYVSFHYLL